MNPPSLESAEPTPIEQEPSIIEPKVEIPPEVTKPQQKLAEDSKEEVKIELLSSYLAPLFTRKVS